MKKTFLSILSILSVFILFAQSPQAFKYQAVARDASGTILADQSVAFRISILEGSAAGTAIYTETHASTTNNLGLVNLKIGTGTVVTGVFADINWGGNSYFLQVELDETGGTNYQLMGTTQLLSVPYSLHSETTSDNTRWIKNADDLYYLDGDVGIGTVTPEESALLDLNSNSKGFLPPRMTGEQMMALSNPVEGLVVYNYDLKSICWCDGKKWMYHGGEIACVPLSYGGQTYQTVLIGTLCWMAENLNIGDQIPGANAQTDNSTTEKYCYDDLESNCDTYGGLYQWDEMMEYTAIEGTQGICPPGWHLPSDAEWCNVTLEIDATVDCGVTGSTGTDVGTKMKSTEGWSEGGNGTNESGFTALPGGYRNDNFGGDFDYLYYSAWFWSSIEGNSGNAWGRILEAQNVARYDYDKGHGCSVRCVQD